MIIGHRVVWSFLFLVVLLTLKGDWLRLRASITTIRVAGIYVVSALLIGLNWLLYVWAINSEHIVEASLGYFINPLFSVALGVIILRERLRRLQWLAIGLAALGVAYLTIQHGQPPWISLGLAFTFGLYGMVKKVAPLGASHGLAVETWVLFLPALSYLLVEGQTVETFSSQGWITGLLLVGAGLATTIPLLLYSRAARGLPLWVIGILQYITPTIQFLLGVFLYQEGFSTVQMAGYGVIWLALIIFTTETFINWRKTSRREVSAV